MSHPSFRNRALRICYYNAETRIVDAGLARFESLLKQMGTIQVEAIASLDDPQLGPSDLLIVAASHLLEEDFLKWLQGLAKRMVRQNNIWVPCLIVADVPFSDLADEVLPFAIAENWYFDVMAPDHIESLPIRVANLLRIHDHLHELGRYEKTLNQLSDQVESLRAQLESLGGNAN